jgi:hypothetical protein
MLSSFFFFFFFGGVLIVLYENYFIKTKCEKQKQLSFLKNNFYIGSSGYENNTRKATNILFILMGSIFEGPKNEFITQKVYLKKNNNTYLVK